MLCNLVILYNRSSAVQNIFIKTHMVLKHRIEKKRYFGVRQHDAALLLRDTSRGFLPSRGHCLKKTNSRHATCRVTTKRRRVAALPKGRIFFNRRRWGNKTKDAPHTSASNKKTIPRQTCPDGARRKASGKTERSGSALANWKPGNEGGRRWNHEDWVSGYPCTTGTSPAGAMKKISVTLRLQ